MKLTDTLRPPRVQIGRTYVAPPMPMSVENKLLQAALLPPGRPWEERAPAVWKQVALGLLIVGAFGAVLLGLDLFFTK